MSLAVLADHMASRGRGPDSMLIHMSPNEVAGLQALANQHGGSLTINPESGLPEAGFLDKLLPTIIGAGISYFSGGTIDPMTAAAMVGGAETVRTGDIGRGLQAGLGAYGGAGLTAGMSAAGTGALTAEAAAIAGTDIAAMGAAQGYSPELIAAMQQQAIDEAALQGGAQFTAGESLSKGFDLAKANPMQAIKDYGKPLMYAAGPAILAAASAEEGMPKTVTKPGMIRPYTYNPYSGGFIGGTPYEAAPTKSANGGLMGLAAGGMAGYGDGDDVPRRVDNNMAQGGLYEFAQRSEPVLRMAGGGVPGYALGGYVPTDAEIFKYFQAPNLTDTQIAADMQKFGVSAADIARATGTQGQQADYERRFVNTLVAPGTDASEFLAATKSVGLQNQALANAMQNAGLSQGAQYALTHADSDAGFTNGIIDARTSKPVDFYTNIGYTAGALPGDQGGLEGLYANINYATSGLQNQINAGKMTVAQAQDAALAELARTGVSVADVKAATGKSFSNLFAPKKEDKKPITCGPGYRLNAAGTACEPIPIIDQFQCPSGFHYDPVTRSCVPNVDATQNTTTDVTTPTNISTAPSTSLPVGVSGAGITTINPNGTITTRPDLSLGMKDVRDAYTRGGGSLGFVPYSPRSLKELEDKYPITGGSKQSFDYLMGRTPYSATPYTKTGEVMKSYAESVLGMPTASSSKMYTFDPATKTYKVNPDYAIPTFDSKGVKSYNLTNKDVATFMDTKPSTEAFYTWATTNNLLPEQIATATGRSINEISKLYTGAKALTGEDGKIDPAKVAEQEKTDFDYQAYLKANPDVQAELDKGIANFGDKSDLAAAAWNHYTTYGKAQGRQYTKKAADGGLMAMAMARGGAAQFNLGDYSDGGRLLRGPGDGVSDSIPASIGNKRPARLADGEFVVPARIVSELGNGSTEAGARKLYAMMDRVQAARRGTVGKGRVAKNSRADKYLPA